MPKSWIWILPLMSWAGFNCVAEASSPIESFGGVRRLKNIQSFNDKAELSPNWSQFFVIHEKPREANNESSNGYALHVSNGSATIKDVRPSGNRNQKLIMRHSDEKIDPTNTTASIYEIERLTQQERPEIHNIRSMMSRSKNRNRNRLFARKDLLHYINSGLETNVAEDKNVLRNYSLGANSDESNGKADTSRKNAEYSPALVGNFNFQQRSSIRIHANSNSHRNGENLSTISSAEDSNVPATQQNITRRQSTRIRKLNARKHAPNPTLQNERSSSNDRNDFHEETFVQKNFNENTKTLEQERNSTDAIEINDFNEESVPLSSKDIGRKTYRARNALRTELHSRSADQYWRDNQANDLDRIRRTRENRASFDSSSDEFSNRKSTTKATKRNRSGTMILRPLGFGSKSRPSRFTNAHFHVDAKGVNGQLKQSLVQSNFDNSDSSNLFKHSRMDLVNTDSVSPQLELTGQIIDRDDSANYNKQQISDGIEGTPLFQEDTRQSPIFHRIPTTRNHQYFRFNVSPAPRIISSWSRPMSSEPYGKHNVNFPRFADEIERNPEEIFTRKKYETSFDVIPISKNIESYEDLGELPRSADAADSSDSPSRQDMRQPSSSKIALHLSLNDAHNGNSDDITFDPTIELFRSSANFNDDKKVKFNVNKSDALISRNSETSNPLRFQKDFQQMGASIKPKMSSHFPQSHSHDDFSSDKDLPHEGFVHTRLQFPPLNIKFRLNPINVTGSVSDVRSVFPESPFHSLLRKVLSRENSDANLPPTSTFQFLFPHRLANYDHSQILKQYERNAPVLNEKHPIKVLNRWIQPQPPIETTRTVPANGSLVTGIENYNEERENVSYSQLNKNLQGMKHSAHRNYSPIVTIISSKGAPINDIINNMFRNQPFGLNKANSLNFNSANRKLDKFSAGTFLPNGTSMAKNQEISSQQHNTVNFLKNNAQTSSNEFLKGQNINSSDPNQKNEETNSSLIDGKFKIVTSTEPTSFISSTMSVNNTIKLNLTILSSERNPINFTSVTERPNDREFENKSTANVTTESTTESFNTLLSASSKDERIKIPTGQSLTEPKHVDVSDNVDADKGIKPSSPFFTLNDENDRNPNMLKEGITFSVPNITRKPRKIFFNTFAMNIDTRDLTSNSENGNGNDSKTVNLTNSDKNEASVSEKLVELHKDFPQILQTGISRNKKHENNTDGTTIYKVTTSPVNNDGFVNSGPDDRVNSDQATISNSKSVRDTYGIRLNSNTDTSNEKNISTKMTSEINVLEENENFSDILSNANSSNKNSQSSVNDMTEKGTDINFPQHFDETMAKIINVGTTLLKEIANLTEQEDNDEIEVELPMELIKSLNIHGSSLLKLKLLDQIEDSVSSTEKEIEWLDELKELAENADIEPSVNSSSNFADSNNLKYVHSPIFSNNSPENEDVINNSMLPNADYNIFAKEQVGGSSAHVQEELFERTRRKLVGIKHLLDLLVLTVKDTPIEKIFPPEIDFPEDVRLERSSMNLEHDTTVGDLNQKQQTVKRSAVFKESEQTNKPSLKTMLNILHNSSNSSSAVLEGEKIPSDIGKILKSDLMGVAKIFSSDDQSQLKKIAQQTFYMLSPMFTSEDTSFDRIIDKLQNEEAVVSMTPTRTDVVTDLQGALQDPEELSGKAYSTMEASTMKEIIHAHPERTQMYRKVQDFKRFVENGSSNAPNFDTREKISLLSETILRLLSNQNLKVISEISTNGDLLLSPSLVKMAQQMTTSLPNHQQHNHDAQSLLPEKKRIDIEKNSKFARENEPMNGTSLSTLEEIILRFLMKNDSFRQTRNDTLSKITDIPISSIIPLINVKVNTSDSTDSTGEINSSIDIHPALHSIVSSMNLQTSRFPILNLLQEQPITSDTIHVASGNADAVG